MAIPVVSVAMCVHNGSRYLREAVESVFAQTFQDFEVIVVDDGSTDGGVDRIEREFRDDRLRIVRQRQQTLRVARPVAIAQAKGEYIAFLDHDDVWLPHKLERQAAIGRASPDAALVFCDCFIIDESGGGMGRLSDQYDFDVFDLTGTRGHLELLRRGNFVAYPTAFARTASVRAVGGFNHSYQYVSDYDLWLRLARRHGLKFIDEPLAKYRIHETQFTQRHSEVTLAEHYALLRQILRSSSYPRHVRIAVGDNLLGQHRLAWRRLLRQRRFGLAVRAALGICRYPDRVRDSLRHQLGATAVGPALESGISAFHRGKGVCHLGKNVVAHIINGVRRVALRAMRAPRRVVRVLRGKEPLVKSADRASEATRPTTATAAHVWIDGSSLGRDQTGYFNLLSELIRRLAQHESPPCVIHVLTQHSGRDALLTRLGPDGSRIRFHPIGWRAAHWSHVHALLVGWHAQLLLGLASAGLIAAGLATANAAMGSLGAMVILAQTAVLLDELTAGFGDVSGRPRLRYAARLVRFLWRRLPAPRRRAPARNTVEILFWRGRFRWRDSHRIAIVQDLTTRIHPELHTPGNVAEFDEFLGYVQRHAHTIATVSEQSRRDIIDRVAVCPDSVSVIPMPIHPQYVRPRFDPGFAACYGLDQPYVLCVGTLEPRKNLRRLVRALELLKDEQAATGLTLVLVGPSGWDTTFRDFLLATDVASRVRILGFVPLEHMPSLYHCASAVICPSVYEGFGIPVMEAMCSSSVVLASRISSLPEVLGEDGILFDPYVAKDIAGALLRALTMSPTEVAAYRRRCRSRGEAHLTRLAAEGPLPGFSPALTGERT
jgi:glycosyltransferase involved in cell wall biosynthesis